MTAAVPDPRFRDQLAEAIAGSRPWLAEPWDELPEGLRDQFRVTADALLPLVEARVQAAEALASVLRKLMAADSFLSLSTHRSTSGHPVQFTLNDTTVEVTDGEADALRAVAWS